MSNKSKIKILKNLLTTASAIGIIAGNAGVAFGAAANVAVSDGIGGMNLDTGANVVNTLGAGVVWANGDSLRLAHNVAIDANVGGGTVIEAIGIEAGVTPGILTITTATTLGSVSQHAGNVALANLNVTLAHNLELTGTASHANTFSTTANAIPVSTYDKLGDIDYNNTNKILKINDANGAITLTGDFLNTANAALDVTTSLIAEKASVATIKTITIANGESLKIGKNENINLLQTVGSTIGFAGANSHLELTNTDNAAKTVTLYNHLDTGGANTGKLTLHATAVGLNPGGLIITANGGDKDLGSDGLAAHSFLELNITGDKAVTLNRGVKVHADELKIADGSIFIAKDESVAAIETITISAGVAAATLVFDATDAAAAVDINVTKVDQIAFNHADALLVLRNTSAANDRTFTLQNHVNPGANQGIVELNATVAGKKVILNSNGGKTLGVAGGGNLLKALNIRGAGTAVISGGANFVNITNIDELNIVKGARLESGTNTAFAIAAVNIGITDGAAVGAATLIVDIADGNTDLLNGGAAITFAHADSVLGITNSSAGNHRTVTLNANFAPGGDDEGILEFSSTGGKILTIKENGGGEHLGDPGGDKFKRIDITQGEVVFHEDMPVGTHILNVKAGKLTAKNDSITATPVINIGANDGVLVNGLPTGQLTAGTLALDATAGNMDIGNASQINFFHADSILQLTHSGGGDKTFTLHDNLIPTADSGVNALDDFGKVQLTSSGGGQKLIVASNLGETLGIDDTHRLRELIIDGAQVTEVDVETFVKKITVGSLATVGAVGDTTFTKAVNVGDGGGVNFTKAGKLIFNEDSTIGAVDFADKAGVIEVDGGVDLTASLTSTAGNKGKLTFVGDGTLTGGTTGNGFDTLEVGAGDVTINGIYKIAKINATGANTLTLADGFGLTGKIDNPAVHALKLDFQGAGAVTGTLGQTTALGDIDVRAGAVVIGGNIKATKITFNNAGAANAPVGVIFGGTQIDLTDVAGLAFAAGANEFTGMVITDTTVANPFAVATGSINRNVTINSAVTVAGNQAGAVVADVLNNASTLTINGAIGAANHEMKYIVARGGATVHLTGGAAFVTDIDTGDADTGKLKMSHAGPHKIGYSHGNDKGTFEVNADLALAAGSVISTDVDRLKIVNFTGDHNLTLADGINIFTGDVGVQTDLDNHGTFTLQGSHTIDAIVGQNHKLKDIKVTGANKTVTLNKAVNLQGNIEIADTSIVKLGENTQLSTIKGAAGANQGTLEFTKLLTLTGNVGTGNSLSKVILSASEAKITGDMTTNSVHFTGNTNAILTIEGATAIGAGGVTTEGDLVHSIAVNGDFNSGVASIGAVGHRLRSVHMLADNTATINSTNFFSGVSTETDGQGKVNFTADGAFSYDLGSTDKALDTVTFTENATVKGDVYAGSALVNIGKTASFIGENERTILLPKFGMVTVRTIVDAPVNLMGAGSVAIFGDGTAVSSIIPAINEQGEVRFLGTAYVGTIRGSKVNNVTFANNMSNEYLFGDISAKTITANNSSLVIRNSIIMEGDVTAAGLSLGLREQKLTYVGKAVITGNFALSSNITEQTNTAGSLVISGGGSELDLSGTSAANISIDASSNLSDIGRNYVLIATKDGGVIKAPSVQNFTASEQNSFVKWTYDSATYTASIQDNLKAGVEQIFGTTNPELVETLAGGFATGSDGEKFVNAVGKMNNDAQQDAGNRISPVSANLNVSSFVTPQLSSAISNDRIGRADVGAKFKLTQITGVSAGDNDGNQRGAWATPFFAQATQKMRKNVSGFKAKTYGGTFGFDNLVSEDLLLGLAYTMVDTKLNHKDKKRGDTTRANTHLLSIYGAKDLPNNWFAQGIASFGLSRVINNEARRVSNTAYETARGKYDSTTYSAELMGGYNHKLNDSTNLTPMFGLRYARFNDAGYTETGTTFSNVAVKRKAVNKLEAVLGVRSTMAVEMNKVILSPELHGFVNVDMLNKAPKVDARLNGLFNPLPSKATKPARAFVNLGGSISAKYSMMEYGIGYDANIANKYIGHQGTIKVRVNF